MLNIDRITKILFFLASSVLVIRILFIYNTILVDDEAYYAIYARHLSWGYIDHGPVVAFLIWIFTCIFENSFTVRIGAVLLMSLLPFILYFFINRYFNNKSALILSILVTVNLMLHMNAIIITPDVPLAFFSILAILFYYIAYFEDQKYFYIGGAMLGIAALSKVSALFPAIGIALLPFINKEKRHFLSNKHFYGSFILAFIFVIPFIKWNLDNDLAFIRYQGGHISRSGNLSDFLGLWTGLFILIGPLYFYYSFAKPLLNIFAWNNISTKMKYFTSVTIVPLIYFLTHSMFTKLELNWAAPIFYGGAFILMMDIDGNRQYMRTYYLQIIYSFVLIITIMIQTFFPLLPLNTKSDPTNRYYMYETLLQDTKKIIENPDYHNYRVVSNNFQIPSMVNFYLNPSLESICLSIDYHETLYSFLYTNEDIKGEDFIFIYNKNYFPNNIKKYFSDYELIDTSVQYRNGDIINEYTIWLVKNYSGKNNLF